MDIFEVEVQNYLLKCELEFRAERLGSGNLKWLEPHCNDLKDIIEFLRSIGFRIKEVVDTSYEDGIENHKQWVVTTSNILVFVNTKNSRGFFCKRPDYKSYYR